MPRLVVVVDREPYAHVRLHNGGVEIQRPACGVTAGLEPLLRARGGTWIGYATGSADREYSDATGRLSVPPEDPRYTLRRIWMTEEERDGYYVGFANEGLWPLSHVVFERPCFRLADWRAYRTVNQRFADAVAEEGTDTLVLVQDYHLALVPRLLRDRSAAALVGLFWHIPWPTPDVARICPWIGDIVEGMLGASTVGFHTPSYCANFIETARRELGCSVDEQSATVEWRGHRTVVRPHPISVVWPYPASSRAEGSALRQALGIAPDAHVAVGVDRADYTKGIVERIQAVEAMLTARPELAGKFVLVQIAAPTRTMIERYRELSAEIRNAAARVNARFASSRFTPVILREETFTPEQVRVHYAMADSALVTPLHDGMNLVAKEYVASCTDQDGVLVLSRFAGAANELHEALLVNAWDVEAIAGAIVRAIEMPAAERRERMRAMRDRLAATSLQQWSAALVNDLLAAASGTR